MEQKSILSFFKKASPKQEANGCKEAENKVEPNPTSETNGNKRGRNSLDDEESVHDVPNSKKPKSESTSPKERNGNKTVKNSASKKSPAEKSKPLKKSPTEKSKSLKKSPTVKSKSLKKSPTEKSKSSKKTPAQKSKSLEKSPDEKSEQLVNGHVKTEVDSPVNGEVEVKAENEVSDHAGTCKKEATGVESPVKRSRRRINVISDSEGENEHNPMECTTENSTEEEKKETDLLNSEKPTELLNNSDSEKEKKLDEEVMSKSSKRKKKTSAKDDSKNSESSSEEKPKGKGKKLDEDMSKTSKKKKKTSSKDDSKSAESSSEEKPKGKRKSSTKKKSEKKAHTVSSDEKETSDGLADDDVKDETLDEKPKIHPFFGSAGKSPGTQDSSKSKSGEKGYNPAKSRYHPVEDAIWKKDEKVPYGALAKTLEEIENTSARLRMIEILSNYLRSVMVLSPNDLLPSLYLCLNKVAPDYEGLELGIGETLLMRALAQATGRTLDKIKSEVAVKGDLGLVAESSRSNQKVMFAPPKLTISMVFGKLKEIAQMSGTSSMNKKIEKIQVMFVACRESEARYLIRSLSGKLRIGLAEQSVLMALAQAATMTPPNQEWPLEVVDASKGYSAEAFKKRVQEEALILKTTYCECPNYDMLVPVLLKGGISALAESDCRLTPGIPLKPMLAHPTKDIGQILKRFENAKFTCEYKYDGERAQIHLLEDGSVHVYSRNQENNTSKYPDIISLIPKVLKEDTRSFIIDSEAVAWDSANNTILPFQVLSTRKKKNADESEIKVHVCVFAFDLLYLNGESFVKKPLQERRQALREAFNTIENQFTYARSLDTDKIEDIEEFLEDSIKGNCEGLMVKTLDLDATYEIAKRSHNWLKLKKDYLEGVGDTLDLVVIGGYHGKGKRTGTYGGFLLACYDEENEEYQSICKIGTGFKEEELERHTTFLKKHVIPNPKSYYQFHANTKPDEWFEAVQVWEVKCADFSKSPIHKAAAGIVDPEKGISLRFPRFLRIRDDKKPEDATNASQVADMYSNQEQVKNQKKDLSKRADDDEELL